MTAARFLLLAVLCLACARAPAEEIPAEKKADIEKVLEMTGSLAIGKQMALLAVTQMSQAIKRSHPEIPERTMDALPAEIMAVFDENAASFKELIMLIYDKHFTGEEVKQMIDFYSTDLGKKMIQEMPALAKESFGVGQRWGMSLGPQLEERIRARLAREGIKL